MLDLTSFHRFFVVAAIVLLAITGLWGLVNARTLLGAISLGVAAGLVIYAAYFARRLERM
ncbi:MAG TPA: hypothetical protein VKE96_24305 [Vicinamibacterales bacterium]|nr:hypothetical protein [Vicinamibacterales bacterium]